MSLIEPIVEGAYYEREDGFIGQATIEAKSRLLVVLHVQYRPNGTTWLGHEYGYKLTRRVWLVYADPAEVVTELRAGEQHARKNLLAGHSGCEVDGWECAADLVAEKLGVK